MMIKIVLLIIIIIIIIIFTKKWPTCNNQDLIWYFAYGANLDPQTLQRRNITVHASRNFILPNYQLTFNVPGIPILEPYFANLVFTGSDDDQVEGVLYQISVCDLNKLARHEKNYKLIQLPKYKIYTFINENYTDKKSHSPSSRYKNKILYGARIHNLSQNYQNQLNSVKSTPSIIPDCLINLGDQILPFLSY